MNEIDKAIEILSEVNKDQMSIHADQAPIELSRARWRIAEKVRQAIELLAIANANKDD